MKRFYVYAYLREDRFSPYYIGKGQGKRAIQNHKRRVKKPPSDRIVYLKQNLTEEEAFQLEKLYILMFGRFRVDGGILYNTCDGGHGGNTYERTEHHKQMARESRIKHHLTRTYKETKPYRSSKPVTIDGVTYQTRTQAAQALGIHPCSLSRALRSRGIE